jgi:hypothetical protein
VGVAEAVLLLEVLPLKVVRLASPLGPLDFAVVGSDADVVGFTPVVVFVLVVFAFVAVLSVGVADVVFVGVAVVGVAVVGVAVLFVGVVADVVFVGVAVLFVGVVADVVFAFVEDNWTVGIGFVAALLSNVTPFKKKVIWLAFESVNGG